MRRPCKKKRWLAQPVAQYGLGILDFPGFPGRTYETTFALFLLAGTVATLRSCVVLDGVKGALSTTVDKHFFEAMLGDEEAADFYHGLHSDRVKFQMNSGRQRAELGEAGL